MGKVQVAEIGGIPLIIDASLILLVILWLLPDLQRGDTEGLVLSIFVLVGVLFSVLLHELGHAFAGQYFGVRTSHMELNCLGGLCFLQGQPRLRWQRIVVALAGLVVTFLVWRFCVSVGHLIDLAWDNGFELPFLASLVSVLWRVGTINYFMLLFNLLPAFPLDGGTALKEFIAMRFDPYKANFVVSCLGIACAVACAYLGVTSYGPFLLLMAALLLIQNYQVLTTESRMPWRRWN